MNRAALTRKVLVLGQDNRAALAVVRSLGRAGLSVHLGWCPKTAAPARSRYCGAVHLLPSFSPAQSEWKEALLKLVAREQFDLVLPCNDPSILPLQQHRS